LAHVQRIVLEAQANQDLPFEQVVEIAKPPRRLEHSPLFQVLFAWQNHDDLLATLSDVSVEPLPLPVHTVNFDLELNLGERDGGLDGGISYATSLFDQTTVARYADYLVQVLRAMAGDAAQPLPRLRMLGDAERQHLLETLNRTEAEYPRDNGIHQLFEQQAAERPEAIALQFGTQRWSYAELNSRANQLAHHFIERGVHPGTRVGVCLERSHELVVALLAVLKAGGAYVPLDPAYPKQRLAHILDDAAPVLVVCDGTGRHALRDTSPGLSQLVDLTEWPAHGISGEDGNPDPQALGFDASNPAYVIYTSGTTGMPKGVVVEHRNVVNFLHAMARDPGLAAGDRLLAVTSVSFDIAGLEIYLPLSQGARLVLASREEVADPLRLRRLLREQDITVMQATPAGWRALLDAAGEALPGKLRALCGGEALNPALAARLCERFGVVWNLYGPTETTIWSTLARIEACECKASANLRIGRPIANTRIYLLDAHGEPVPRGAFGELYIGGEGVARGYHQRPELTAERFVHDPFSANSHARMYRTGDLARYLADGELEFLGRNDHQVKLRGYRIELGEIESRLREHPSVRDVVVMARDYRDDRRLVAYIIRHAAASLDEPTAPLKQHLAATLPAYMLPSAFVTLHEWPLTPSGKLDRSALPLPGEEAVERRAYVPPVGETETFMAELWRDLLGVGTISRDDHFFDLGGHSLLALQLLGRIEADMALRLEPSLLFKYPTLAEFSRQALLALIALEFDPDQLGQLALMDGNTP